MKNITIDITNKLLENHASREVIKVALKRMGYRTAIVSFDAVLVSKKPSKISRNELSTSVDEIDGGELFLFKEQDKKYVFDLFVGVKSERKLELISK